MLRVPWPVFREEHGGYQSSGQRRAVVKDVTLRWLFADREPGSSRSVPIFLLIFKGLRKTTDLFLDVLSFLRATPPPGVFGKNIKTKELEAGVGEEYHYKGLTGRGGELAGKAEPSGGKNR